ncbi:hypothetical protein MIMGU_mgv1a019033mg, partial [Erythranthe guttata]
MEKRITCRNPILYIFFYLFIGLKNFSTKTAEAQVIPVRVGLVLDMDDYGKMTLDVIRMALSDFYATHDHYTTRLVLVDRDSKGDVVGAAAAGLDLLKNVEVQAIIGPMYSIQANFLISLGQKAQVPIVTFSATSPSLSSLRSPYFIRATLKDSSQVGAIVAIIQAFGWREVVPVYEDNEFGEGILPFLTDALEKVNVRVPYRSVIPPLATDDQIAAELYKLMTMQTRVFVVHVLNPLASRLFTKAKEIGMMSQDYAWIITDSITNDLNSMNPSVIASMLGVIGVRPYVPKTKELDDFAIRYKQRVRQSRPKAPTPDVDIYRLWAYDSATALAMAVEEALPENPEYREANVSRNSTDLEAFGVSLSGPELIQALSSVTFTGLAGNFRLVDGQLQAPPYQIVNIDGPRASSIGYWTKENGLVKELNFESSNTNKYSTSRSNLGSIVWPGDKSSPPKGWVIPTWFPFSTMVFPIGSPLVPDVSRAILNVTEGRKMVEIERKWFGDKTTCSDSDTVLSSKSLELESFMVLFSAVGAVGFGALTHYVFKFLYDNWDVVKGEDAPSKLLRLLRIFLSKKENNSQEIELVDPHEN